MMNKRSWILAAVAALLLVEFLGFVALLILVFPLVVQGRVYPFASIRDISVVNSATPYYIGEYQLLVFTEKETLRLPVGYDNEYARNLAVRLWQQVKGSDEADKPA